MTLTNTHPGALSRHSRPGDDDIHVPLQIPLPLLPKKQISLEQCKRQIITIGVHISSNDAYRTFHLFRFYPVRPSNNRKLTYVSSTSPSFTSLRPWKEVLDTSHDHSSTLICLTASNQIIAVQLFSNTPTQKKRYSYTLSNNTVYFLKYQRITKGSRGATCRAYT
ncbi:hypothetical protein BJV82DRAFT_361920 [Fennellomyces sp. T-0311]|nr:hypothetical protein BJV82DRAFT_361920 [Fennellomyces sp. T-0311]